MMPHHSTDKASMRRAATMETRTIEAEDFVDGPAATSVIAGKATETPSITIDELLVDITTLLALLDVAEFLRPANTQETDVAAAMFAGVVMVSTRFVAVHATVPALKPVQVRADVGATLMSKLVPETITFWIVPAVVVLKTTVAVTAVVALTLLDKVILASVRRAL
jgi:hypothetical protein